MRSSETTLILGARGRLGAALAGSAEFGRVIALDRSVYAPWTGLGAADDVSAYLDRLSVPDDTRILVACGVTDPARSGDDHYRVNCLLPQNVIHGARRRGFRVITFGTIMELIAGHGSPNPYLGSKLRFAEFVREICMTDPGVLHLRLHTLYGGGPPAGFMFLGQMRDALVRGTPFEMSEGTQLREYHHVGDEVAAIAHLLRHDASGIIELSHGQPVRLRDLAVHIFSAFGCLSSLKVGARPMADHENLHTVFQRPPLLDGVPFREAPAAVTDYLRAYVQR